MAELALLPMSCILKTSFNIGYKLYRDFQEKKKKLCLCVEDKFKADIKAYVSKTHSDIIVFDLDTDCLKYLRPDDKTKMNIEPVFTDFVKIKFATLIYYNFIPQCSKIIFLTNSVTVAKSFKNLTYFLPDEIYFTENTSVQLSRPFADIEVEARLRKRLNKKVLRFSSVQDLLEKVKNKIN
jgi:hypothetical protein